MAVGPELVVVSNLVGVESGSEGTVNADRGKAGLRFQTLLVWRVVRRNAAAAE